MWMLIPLSFSTLFLLQIIPGLERYQDENYRTKVLTQGLISIQNEAFAYGKSNQNFVGIIPSNAIQLQTQLDWNSEIVHGNGDRFVLTWLSDFEPDDISARIFFGSHEFKELSPRPGFFWGKYSIKDADSALIGTTVVPLPTQRLGDGIFMVGDLI